MQIKRFLFMWSADLTGLVICNFFTHAVPMVLTPFIAVFFTLLSDVVFSRLRHKPNEFVASRYCAWFGTSFLVVIVVASIFGWQDIGLAFALVVSIILTALMLRLFPAQIRENSQ